MLSLAKEDKYYQASFLNLKSRPWDIAINWYGAYISF